MGLASVINGTRTHLIGMPCIKDMCTAGTDPQRREKPGLLVYQRHRSPFPAWPFGASRPLFWRSCDHQAVMRHARLTRPNCRIVDATSWALHPCSPSRLARLSPRLDAANVAYKYGLRLDEFDQNTAGKGPCLGLMTTETPIRLPQLRPSASLRFAASASIAGSAPFPLFPR